MADLITRPAPTQQDLRVDLWLAVGLWVAGVISSALMSITQFYGPDTRGVEWGIGATTLACAGIAVRRRYPIPAMFLVCATYFAAVSLKVPELHVGNVAMFIAIYTVGAWVNNRRAAFISRIALIALMLTWLLVTMFFEATGDTDPGLSRVGLFSPYVAYMLINLLINVAFFGGAYYMGDRAYAGALERTSLEQRTVELEAEREVTAAQAVALDRAGIARELHDVVAHHVSAMGVQAGAARLILDKNPQAASAALGEIEKSARSAIDELRLLLDTLRAPGDSPRAVDSASTLGLDSLPTLVQRVDEVGMPTTLTVVGTPRPVPSLVQVNLFRIAQEALTNARRHGGPNATADVRLRYDPQFVEIEVTNTGRQPLVGRAGLGQLGMRERAAASGGTIEITPRKTGGFLVRAHVPLAEVDA